jgi:hypothetical protein
VRGTARRSAVPHTRRLGSIALVLASSAIPVASSPAPPAARVLSAAVAPAEIKYGADLTVAGRLTDAGLGVGAASLALQSEPYPSRRFVTLARSSTGADGSFSFAGVRPDRNTRLRVTLEGSTATTSPVLAVIVDPDTTLKARSLGPGRTRLNLRMRHTPWGRSESVSARWFLAARGTRVFRLAAVTPTRALSRYVTYAGATINPPSKRFVYRVCLNPAWERAMGAPATHRSCPEHDFAVRRDVR